ncbi:hypothetical protein [Oceanisphaera sediminis]|uniref:Uncharacterized protein n=1 Tax=Oceanisphaera sediminis TaxID=981381 RepID=A0ABP7E4W4_9GAMM|nr:hypothetical protein [uncultured Oceanisphaera sp.]
MNIKRMCYLFAICHVKLLNISIVYIIVFSVFLFAFSLWVAMPDIAAERWQLVEKLASGERAIAEMYGFMPYRFNVHSGMYRK